MKNTRLIHWFMSILILLPAYAAMAQQADGGIQGLSKGLGANGHVLFGGLEAGRFDFVQFDRGELQKFLAQEVFKRSDKDREYAQRLVEELEAEFAALNEKHLGGQDPRGLRTLSMRSLGGQEIPVYREEGDENFDRVTWAEAVAEFQKDLRNIRIKAQRLNTLNLAMLPSFQQMLVDGQEIEIDPNMNVDGSAPAQFFEEWLSDIEIVASYLPQARTYPDGVPEFIRPNVNNAEINPETGKPVLGPGFTFDTSRWRFPPEKIQRMREEAIMLRRGVHPQLVERLESNPNANVDPFAYQNKAREFTTWVKDDLIGEFLAQYGFTERWRIQGDINNPQNRERREWANRIAEVFWMRSFFRMEYRMPVGAIGMDYDKRIANLDVLLNRTRDLFQFRKNPTFDYAELIGIRQNQRLILQQLDRRTTRLTSGGRAEQAAAEEGNLAVGVEGDIAEDVVAVENTGLIPRGVGLLTLLGGNRPLADSGLPILRLLAADTVEEQLVLEGRYDELEDRYEARYMSTPEDVRFYEAFENRYESYLRDMGMDFGRSPRGYWVELVAVAAEVENYLDLADSLWAQWQVAMNKDQSKAAQRRNERRENRRNNRNRGN